MITARTQPPNSEYDSELSDAGDETETELDDAFDDANYSDESIPTFSSSKTDCRVRRRGACRCIPDAAGGRDGGRDRGRLGGGDSTAGSYGRRTLGGFVREQSWLAHATWAEVEAAMQRLVHLSRGT